MRSRIAALTLVALAVLLPAPAHAYVIGGSPWPGRTITYFNSDKAMAGPVALAVAAWNASGANVRFRAAPASRARVIIRKHVPPSSGGAAVDEGSCEGYADIGYQGRREFVDLDPGCRGLIIPTAVAAHELGHILGLNHPQRGCATMTPLVWAGCPAPKNRWDFRCRFLQPDDVRGAAKLYGGRVRPHPDFCELFKAPSAPSGLKLDGSGGIQLTWRNPPAPKLKFAGLEQPFLEATMGAQKGSCPKSAAVAPSQVGVRALPGRTQSATFPASELTGPGTWCFSVFVTDQFGRGAGITTATITIPNSPPTAAFELSQDSVPGCIYAVDGSTDSDGKISQWHWDFGAPGDPDNVVENDGGPGHCYQQSGTYTVTLTVTDDLGATGTTTRQIAVTVPPPEPPPPEF